MTTPATTAHSTLDLPQLVTIPGGTFVMGKAGSAPDESPPHRVTLAGFRAAISPVTNAQYLAYVVETGIAPPPFAHEERFAAPGLPVVGISWFDASAYCAWLESRTGTAYRLPTEAEREFAALGGLTGGDWPWSGAQHPLGEAVLAASAPHPPSKGCANGYGLRCMADNVHEWCSDWYSATYYAESPIESPTGADGGKRRASRGGSWRHRIPVTRINARSSLAPEFRYADFGFRVYANA